MKKITEELNRFNSINQYISEQFGGSLNEEESRIGNIYRNIITRTSGPGTELWGPSGLLAWIKALNSYDEFKQLDDRIKQFKEYDDFADMINSELESNNANQVMEIIRHLRKIGVNNGHSGTETKFTPGTYVVQGPLNKGEEDVINPNNPIELDGVTIQTKQNQKVNPVLQQTISFNKQIQQKMNVSQTGKLTHADLEKLIKMLRPAATTSTSGEISPAGTVASTQAPLVASTLPQQQK